MRINKFVALATGMSRRNADKAITGGKVTVNDNKADIGIEVHESDTVTLNGMVIETTKHITISLNKPIGYVCSRNGQGSKTIYDLLPAKYHHLKPVGRLDKDSSGLLLLTNDGTLAHNLTHPRFAKEKVYQVTLDEPLRSSDRQHIQRGVQLEDGLSKLSLDGQNTTWTVAMHEGRNRQIRRTFAALGYSIVALHRTQFGNYHLSGQKPGSFQEI